MRAEEGIDVVIVGAGPGGLAAAQVLAEADKQVLVIDEAPQPGGRVWAGTMRAPAAEAQRYLQSHSTHKPIIFRCATRVIAANASELVLENSHSSERIPFATLILATGARELQLPFAGWTLPGVISAGGLQLMAKAGMRFDGKRVVMAGSGPLLLAAAASLRAAGANVVCVAERAPFARVARFASTLFRHPDRLLQTVKLRAQLGLSGFHVGQQLVAANGQRWVERVTLRDSKGRLYDLPCDYLGVGFGLVPNIELGALLGCSLTPVSAGPQAIMVNEYGRTSLPHVYAVGEVAGIGGKAKALIEGELAAMHILGREQACERLTTRLNREHRYAAQLAACFAPRLDELTLPTPATIVCRCEDVTWEDIQATQNWRDARLAQRCGMGHCQGRYCGAALEVLRGDTRADWREPLYPCRLETLAKLQSTGPQ